MASDENYRRIIVLTQKKKIENLATTLKTMLPSLPHAAKSVGVVQKCMVQECSVFVYETNSKFSVLRVRRVMKYLHSKTQFRACCHEFFIPTATTLSSRLPR